MKNQKSLRGVVLAVCAAAALLVAVLLRTFVPRFILPGFDTLYVIALTLIALVLDVYLGGNKRAHDRLFPLYAALIFGVFPWAAGFVSPFDAIRLAVIGAVVGVVIPFLYDAMLERLASGPAAKLAPLFSACGMYLALQGLMGLF